VKTTRTTLEGAAPVQTFDEFFHAWFPSLARAMALIVRDWGDGSEIAQEGFIRLYRNWPRMTSADHARNFVFRASINLARTHLGKRRPLELIGLGRTELFGSIADGSETSNERMLLAEALARLSDRQRECVVLVDYLGHDADSAAQILGLAPPTVRVHLSRGRAQLRKRLSERKEER
jgi:RNA polymerase sigma factor (sigma-70 family)